jgi:hypothetical protein
MIEFMLLALRERRDILGGGEPMLITEVMLLLTEWFLLMEKDPSDEMVESGLGMISTFSENPTRGRDPGLDGDDSREPNSALEKDTERSNTGVLAADSPGWPNGVFGRLVLVLGGVSCVGSIIDITSWLDKAADRRCACPRFPEGPGTGSALLGSSVVGSAAVALVGLVLRAFVKPSLESPPTNSLPPLLCPLRGVSAGEAASTVGSEGVSCRPDVLSALKEKLGRADVVLLCVPPVLPGCAPGTPRCIDIGRRREDAGPVCRFDGLGPLGSMGKENDGFGTISNFGSVTATLFVCTRLTIF